MTLDSIVRVTATIEPAGASGENFGRSLFVYAGDASGTTRAAIVGDRARDLRVNRYDSLDDVAEDFASDHAAYLAAAAYFAQTPFPRALVVAGWVAAGAEDYILGATGYADATSLASILAAGSSAEFRVAGGQSVTVDLAGVSGSGDTGFGNAAAAIQTALRTITSAPNLSAVEVTYDTAADAFQVKGAIGVDLGGVLSGDGAEAVGLDTAATYHPGFPAETITDALARVQRVDDTWYWLLLSADQVASASLVAVATWLQTQPKQGVFAVTGPDVLVAAEATSRAAQVADLGSERATLIWSAVADYKDASLAGLFSGTDFDARDSLPTAFGKALPGRASDMLTSTQRAELTRKRINTYEVVGGHAIVQTGVTVRAEWFTDTRYWLDWLIQRIQTTVFALLRGNPRVALTVAGIGRIQAVIEDACQEVRRPGGIAPGPVPATVATQIRRVTGTDFGSTLSRGFLVHVGSLDDQSAADRAAREAPPVSVWVRDASAVHSLDVAIRLSA
ncbi:MAG: DUF3383 domain-containing protein [Chloroflexi bacterium]|nr:DUF3383 domain-containing protein [Chloroflexota bacterium]